MGYGGQRDVRTPGCGETESDSTDLEDTFLIISGQIEPGNICKRTKFTVLKNKNIFHVSICFLAALLSKNLLNTE